MSSALEMAQKIAADKREKEKKAREAEESNKSYRERQRVELQAHVNKTLMSFHGVNGLERKGNKLVRPRGNNYDHDTCDDVIATVWVAWNKWEFQGSDESPVVDIEEYVIFYNVKNCPYKEAWSSRIADFDKGFGEAMAVHL